MRVLDESLDGKTLLESVGVSDGDKLREFVEVSVGDLDGETVLKFVGVSD